MAKKQKARSSKTKTTEKAKPKAKSNGRPIGKTTGVGVVKTWVHIFEKNEALPKTKKLADAEITKFMQSEFPGKKSKIFERVSTVRWRYNKGILTKDKIPKVKSKRYDVGGKRNGSNGKAKRQGQK